MQEALPLFQKLADVSRHMEGEKYILSSSYWGALHEIESALQPQAADSPTLTSLRAAMYHDHFTNRVTLNTSIESPLHVLMHLLDPRYEISLFLRNSHPELWPSLFPFNVDGACVVILSSLKSSGTKPRTCSCNMYVNSFLMTAWILFLSPSTAMFNYKWTSCIRTWRKHELQGRMQVPIMQNHQKRKQDQNLLLQQRQHQHSHLFHQALLTWMGNNSLRRKKKKRIRP